MEAVAFALVVTLMASLGALVLLAAVWGTRRNEPIAVPVRSVHRPVAQPTRGPGDGSRSHFG